MTRSHRVTRRPRDDDDGFSLLEVLVAVAVFSLALTMTLGLGREWVSHAALRGTSVRLVADLRFAQESAVATGEPWGVRLSPYTPDYTILDRGTIVSKIGFAQGVGYTGGYLTLTSGLVLYDVMGNASTSGTISLDAGNERSMVHLYMGTGLQDLEAGIR